jgi:hypothetical protein
MVPVQAAFVPRCGISRADEVIGQRRHLLRCVSPSMALNGHGALVAGCPLLGEQRKSFARIELFRV